jgi:hypothetical protein
MLEPVPPVRGSDTFHATTWGLLVASVVIVGIFVGSRGLRDFDPALVSYAGASVFAAFRSRLSLCHVVAPTSDARVLVSGMANLPKSAPAGRKHTSSRSYILEQLRTTKVH